jgi:hypothetical protein
MHAASGAEAMVHLAETGRELPQEASVGQSPNGHLHGHQDQSVEPDLDHLARQVYQVLKNRLAAERRRST